LILILGVIVMTSYQYPKKAKSTDNNYKSEVIKSLIRQSARWSTASTQDENPMIAVLHANYGAAYLWALRDIALDSEIQQIASINIKKFTQAIVNIQDTATKKAISICPQFGPAKTYLTSIAGEG